MGTFLTGLGSILIAIGLWQGWDAIHMNVLVGEGAQSVANLQAMQVQFMTLVLACALFLSGIITLCAGCLAEHLKLQANRILRGEKPPSPLFD